jgi:hypothetical protein
VTKAEFFGDTPVLWIFVPAIAFTAVIAWAIWRERAWVRQVILAFWLIPFAMALFVPDADMASRIASSASTVIGVAVTAWYLYKKSNVVAYFERRKHGDAFTFGPVQGD